jgi:predicted nucleic acid-binding protein
MYVGSETEVHLVIDASAILAVLLREPQRDALVAATTAAALLTPGSTPWEVGNALVAGWRRKRLTPGQMEAAWTSFLAIPLRQVEVDVHRSLRLAVEHGLYAYDAYVLESALVRRIPLLTLDAGLSRAARKAGVQVLEVGG